MSSRRRRKRYRAGPKKAAEATAVAAPVGGLGGRCEQWGAQLTRGDLALIRHAINDGWPVPHNRRGPILRLVAERIRDDSPRLAIGAARVILAAEAANLRAEAEFLRTQR